MVELLRFATESTSNFILFMFTLLFIYLLVNELKTLNLVTIKLALTQSSDKIVEEDSTGVNLNG